MTQAFSLKAQDLVAHNINVEFAELVGIAILIDQVGDGAANNPFVFDTPAKYNDGIEVQAGVSFAVNSSVNWLVNFKSTDAQFENGDGSNVIPLNVLTVRETLSGAYSPLSTSDQPLATGSPVMSIALGVSAFTADYKFSPGNGYAPDTYTANVTYTIVPQ